MGKLNVEVIYDIDFIINSLGRGGAERVCVTLANAMYNKGYKVRIITLRDVETNYISDLKKGIVLECLDASKDIFGLFILKRKLINESFKKVMAFDERITSICNYIKIKYNKDYKVVSRVINNIDFQERENKKILYKFMYGFSKKYFKYSDKYIFQCKGMKDRMRDFFKLNEKTSKLVYIYNPLANSFYDVPLELNKDDYFLMVGRLEKQKGYEYLIDALNLCKKSGKNINVKILGEGRLRGKISNLITKYNLNVELLGNVKNTKDYYSKAKALILTSRYEGFPNVLLESIACGCPVISFDCPTGPSEIVNSNNGILIKYLDIYDLSNCLIRFDEIKWNYKKVMNSSLKFKNKDIIDNYIWEIENL